MRELHTVELKCCVERVGGANFSKMDSRALLCFRFSNSLVSTVCMGRKFVLKAKDDQTKKKWMRAITQLRKNIFKKVKIPKKPEPTVDTV